MRDKYRRSFCWRPTYRQKIPSVLITLCLRVVYYSGIVYHLVYKTRRLRGKGEIKFCSFWQTRYSLTLSWVRITEAGGGV